MVSDNKIVWHNDGHSVRLEVAESEVRVYSGECPAHSSPNAKCYAESVNGCGVNYLVDVYGLDLNVGACPASGVLRIAWSFDGWKPWSIRETRLTIIPVDDYDFKSWLEVQGLE